MSFDIALSGINAINKSLETISQNISNSETNGYKSGRTHFASAMAETQPAGVKVSGTRYSVEANGSLRSSGDRLHQAIQGGGFFILKETNGQRVYSRVGDFQIDKDSKLVDGSGRSVQGFAQGQSNVSDVKIDKSPVGALPSTAINVSGRLPDPLPTAPSQVGEISVTYRDASGELAVRNLRFEMVAGAPDTVRVSEVDGPNAVALGDLDPTTMLLTRTPGSGTLPDLNFSGMNAQRGAFSATATEVGGREAGEFVRARIDKDGSVVAEYSNGTSNTQYQLALGEFANVGGLVPVDGTVWRETGDSGVAQLRRPGEGATGVLVSGSLEGSNVNVTDELVSLMSAQRNYQANTKVISTQNEMMRNLMQSI
ncbi:MULTISPECIES: flagellar hook protein FlgE [Pandoraea]|uniref:Flagellar hook protein FlgE n=1 Tax=Pandoraea communis TaxID=2508297 RepID=A0A5E4YWU7_9BURK|nr:MULTISPECIES: flagellar hook-basal body complex protein [Pandoraea]EON15113.1 lateral flagellar hook protein [Pandoraea sp. SD6-2]VVE53256.1 lateral flagellar hook protein [Pandoraea communis]